MAIGGKSARKPASRKGYYRDFVETVVTAVLLALILRAFVVQTFRIPSGSMEDTLLIGDFLVVNKFIYGIKVPFQRVNELVNRHDSIHKQISILETTQHKLVEEKDKINTKASGLHIIWRSCMIVSETMIFSI